MSNKKANAKKNGEVAAAPSGRVSGLKIGKDFCQFHIKGAKDGQRHYAVDGKGGVDLNAAVEVLVAAWAGKRKITVEPMPGDGAESAVASISVGSLRKPAKVEKPAKSKSTEPDAAAQILN